jgi:hypothetical protein
MRYNRFLLEYHDEDEFEGYELSVKRANAAIGKLKSAKIPVVELMATDPSEDPIIVIYRKKKPPAELGLQFEMEGDISLFIWVNKPYNIKYLKSKSRIEELIPDIKKYIR